MKQRRGTGLLAAQLSHDGKQQSGVSWLVCPEQEGGGPNMQNACSITGAVPHRPGRQEVAG
jgi:hypothetical protein